VRIIEKEMSRIKTARLGPISFAFFTLTTVLLHGAGVSVDLGLTDASKGLLNSQRSNGTDGENQAVSCGPAGETRFARRNLGETDDDFPDNYFYFVVTDSSVKGSETLRIAATFFDSPDFAENPVTIALHYTNKSSTGPQDIPNTFAEHPVRWILLGTGRWVRHVWNVSDARFRTFMQGTSDFRFAVTGGPVCIDRVSVTALEPQNPQEHLVAAHYYPWYYPERWEYRDCVTGALRLELLPRQEPALGRYDSSDPQVVAQHLRWCAAYGVNVLILEFIRPGGREDKICRNVIFRSRHARDVKFTVLYDWAIRFGGDLTITRDKIAAACEDFRHLCRYYFTQPTYLRIDDRPLAMIYVTRALRGDVSGLIGSLREACAQEEFDVFLVGDEFYFRRSPSRYSIEKWDGIFGYDVYGGKGGYWGENSTLDLFRRRSAEYAAKARESGVLFLPSIAPGFNDRAVRRICADNPAMPRRLTPGADPTSLFQALLREAALPNADPAFPMVCITSFNEWHEDTQIEPTTGTSRPTNRDTSPTRHNYTQGYVYDDYGTSFLQEIRNATLAVTGTVRGPGGPVANARIEVLDQSTGETVLLRHSFSTGLYTVPRLRLETGQSYRLRVSVSGFPEVVSPPFSMDPRFTITGFDIDLIPPERFVRGDVNADGNVNIADPVCILSYLFSGEEDPCTSNLPRCFDAADANDDGTLDVGDPIALLSFLFSISASLPEPFPDCGPDPTDDDLNCTFYPCRGQRF